MSINEMGNCIIKARASLCAAGGLATQTKSMYKYYNSKYEIRCVHFRQIHMEFLLSRICELCF